MYCALALLFLSLNTCVAQHLERSLSLPFDEPITVDRSKGRQISFFNSDTMVNVEVTVHNFQVGVHKPVLVTVTSEVEIYSWSVPRHRADGRIHGAESRTLCLVGKIATVFLATSSIQPVQLELQIRDVNDELSYLNDSMPHMLRPLARLDRQKYFFDIPKDADAVIVHVTSNDSKCAVAVIRPWNCVDPYDNSPSDMDYVAKQTFMRQAAITVFKSDKNRFMVDIWAPLSDIQCTGSNPTNKSQALHGTPKTMEIFIEPFDRRGYWAILGLPLVILALAGLVTVVCVCRPMAKYLQYPETPDFELQKLGQKPEVEERHSIKGSFFGSLVSIAVLYALPALQLLYNHQATYSTSGDQDVCYYNFKCLRPALGLAAFNNVYSNIGYVIFGICFLVIVCYHRGRFTWRYLEIFYALGIALVLEGVMSGGYHICPRPENFQFDTTFMYIIAALCIYHMYHIRNPDTPGRPHFFYCIVACAVFYVVGSLLSGEIGYRIALTIVYALSALAIGTVLTSKLYLKNSGAQNTLRVPPKVAAVAKKFRFHDTDDETRIKIVPLATIVHCILNIALVCFSCYTLSVDPKNFAAVLLHMFIVNMMVFLAFYLLIKCLNEERIVLGAWLCGFLALVTWPVALYFFAGRRVTQWSKTPAESRALNRPCILGFFDDHDFWHFLSGFSLFVSFILLLVMDASSPGLGAGDRGFMQSRSGDRSATL